jgi:glutaredoxin
MKKVHMAAILAIVALGLRGTARCEIQGEEISDWPAVTGFLLSEKDEAKAEKPQVELYVTAWCIYCKKAANFFRKRGIEFVEYDIEKDREAERRKRLLDRKRGVPFAVINGYRIHGYSEVLYERALKARP